MPFDILVIILAAVVGAVRGFFFHDVKKHRVKK